MTSRTTALAGFAAGILMAATGLAAWSLWPSEEAPAATSAAAPAIRAATGGSTPPAVTKDLPAIRPHFAEPPAAALLFDVDTGDVLWERNSAQRLPIASLTKMMTALLIAERDDPSELATISSKPPRVEGSGLGALKAGQRVKVESLLTGLILVSGNDAAAALAEHDSGSIAKFVMLMNRRAAELGLDCTRYAGPSGLQDRGNYSCAHDLAALARVDLHNREIARLTGTRKARVPFPDEDGVMDLYNNHFFLQRGVRGLPGARVTGLKTGFTDKAGRCYVTTVRQGGRHLGVVLLDSQAPLRQVPVLLRAGFDLPRPELKDVSHQPPRRWTYNRGAGP